MRRLKKIMNIIVAGDFCPQYRLAELFNKEDYQSVLGDVKDAIAGIDYSIVNFECPIANEEDNPITKAGPNIRCTINGLKAVKWAGFQGVTLANNHFNDFGSGGIKKTLDACGMIGVDHVGGGMTLVDASQTLYKEVKGKRLAIINCCEHEFSIATDNSAGSNPLNPIQQYYAIKEAQNKADYVLVIVHGGHELYQLPSPRMQETYRFFIDAGADAVVNHHQHCYSGYEVYHGKPIFYGLGNFCFDKRRKMKKTWCEGYMVKLCFMEKIGFDIIPYLQCAEKAKVILLDRTVYDNELERLNGIISDEEKLKKETNIYYASCAMEYGLVFEPIYNKIFFSLKRKGFLPSLVPQKKFMKSRNYIECESHRDKLMWFLSHI